MIASTTQPAVSPTIHAAAAHAYPTMSLSLDLTTPEGIAAFSRIAALLGASAKR